MMLVSPSSIGGTAMMQGGGTQLPAGNGVSGNAPGGETAYLDSQDRDIIVFPAIQLPDARGISFRQLVVLAKRLAPD
jgi:hypothetical protein